DFGGMDSYPILSRGCGYRLATSLCVGWNPRLEFGHAGSVWRLFSGLVITLRVIWVFPGAFVAQWIRTHIIHQNIRPPTAPGILVLGWAGMRGVIALAAAIVLPQTLADGSPFPQRTLIVFLAFSRTLVTLV